MIKQITHEELFIYFLEALKINTRIVKTHTGYKTFDRGVKIELLERVNKFIYTKQNVKYSGGEYETEEEVFVYQIYEDMGNISIRDENARAVVTLTSNHDILRVTQARQRVTKETFSIEPLLKRETLQEETKEQIPTVYQKSWPSLFDAI
jgi:hypothetical protein